MKSANVSFDLKRFAGIKRDYSKEDVESQQNNQFSESSIYVREDDQDWGSAGMNDVQIDQE